MSKSRSREFPALKDNQVIPYLEKLPESKLPVYTLLEELENLPPQSAEEILDLNARIEAAILISKEERKDVSSAHERLVASRARAVNPPPGF